MILPLQKNSNNSAKCLILLGSRGQKLEKTGFGVELGLPAYSFVNIELNQGNFALLDGARKTLQLPETATREKIKTAHRQLLLTHHPDRNPDNPLASQQCKAIVATYGLVMAYCQSIPVFAVIGHDNEVSFAKEEVEKTFIVDTKGAILARGA